MSCSGCRVLRKGCNEACVLRSSLHWIRSPEAQANATLFLAKFFGRSDLLSFIAAVPHHQRPALFQSLLFEACGRTVNPVSGAVGLLSSGNWHVCQLAADTVLSGGVLRPIPGIELSGNPTRNVDDSTLTFNTDVWTTTAQNLQLYPSTPSDFRCLPDLAVAAGRAKNHTLENRRSLDSEDSIMTSFGSGDRRKQRKLLNLFI
ncbi:LOB domain-containing protein 39-like [Cucurbita pepo subsp. pepo]|uniref:LOB domain-containing protein 39-like n=1 Tax=Cucurbita pepo subsp. pepo TaxID=3664 RepID=UPI000C9D9250|nr:LOB domain-containing protein 39-like [Cucurbita pepo subsp. pepo]